MNVAVFDLDKTLIPQDSFSEFLIFLLRRSIFRLLACMLFVPIWFPLLVLPRTKAIGASIVLWIATFGKDEESLELKIKEFIRKNSIVPYRDGVQAINHHLERGDTVLVVTASAEILAKPLCECIFGSHIRVVGSSLKICMRGFVSDFHCYGSKKNQALSNLDINKVDYFYTDSQSDLPLLKKSYSKILVNGKASAVRSLQKAFGQDFKILNWF